MATLQEIQPGCKNSVARISSRETNRLCALQSSFQARGTIPTLARKSAWIQKASLGRPPSRSAPSLREPATGENAITSGIVYPCSKQPTKKAELWQQCGSNCWFVHCKQRLISTCQLPCCVMAIGEKIRNSNRGSARAMEPLTHHGLFLCAIS